jgi:dipeptidyl aminopeptidase/acylaminoacyl peptidase
MTRVLFVLLVCAAPAAAEPARDHDITTDDYGTLAAPLEVAVSPDGTHVAYCEGRWDPTDDKRKTDLWVVPADGKGKPTRLTGDRANDRTPKWSADGKAAYVLGNRKREAEKKPPYDGTAQVWRVPLDGGEPRAVTRVEGGVAVFDYAPQADALFYSVETTATDNDDFSSLRSKYKLDYGHGSRKVSEVFRLDLQTWRTEKVVADNRYIRDFAVTRDGKRVGMITAPDDTVVKSEGSSRVDVWDADNKKVAIADQGWMKTAASPWPWLESLAWAPDGKHLAFCSIFDAYPTEIIVHTLEGGTWTAKRVQRPKGVHVHGYGSPLRWGAGNSLFYLAEARGNVVVMAANTPLPDDVARGIEDSNRVIYAFDIAQDGSVGAIVRGSPSEFADVYATDWKPKGATRRLTDLNPQTKTWKLPTIKHITWKAADGTDVGGVLELPADAKSGEKLPLVVGIHGGPTASTTADLAYDPHNGRLYWSAHGYAVLQPNYRGSTGYGDKFLTDLIGNENDIEVKDILAGIEHLIKEGIADPDRVGVMGWSNGGYLTNCLICLKDPPVKIKAASSGAGIVDIVSEWGFNDEPAFPRVFKKGLPWEKPDLYRKTSPTYGLGNVTTPTLIHVGGGDERCPPGHSRMLYRALKEYREVPTELCVYPNEPHGLTRLSHRTAKMDWDLAWFDKYLKGKK